MSLKSFHLFFISASIVLSFGAALWGVQLFAADRDGVDFAIAAAFIILGVSLIVYEIRFLKKFKHVRTL